MDTGKLFFSSSSPVLSDASDFFFPRFIVSAILTTFDCTDAKKINAAENLSFLIVTPANI